MEKPSLKIDWATHEAAKYACENWHYSGCLPVGKLVKIGAWENGNYVGVIIFSHGTAKDLGTKYGLTQLECVELTRVALTKHQTPVSRILAIAVKFMKKKCPKVRLLVSFADSEKGHHGGIYQAANWIYAGNVAAKHIIFFKGKEIPLRTYFESYKTDRSIKAKCSFEKRSPKYRYLMPLDERMRKKIELLKKPYPKRATSKDSVVSSDQELEGGAIPTVALHNTSKRGEYGSSTKAD